MDPIQVRLILVGNICVQWAHLEFKLSIATWRMLELDEKSGPLVTGPLDIKALASTAFNLAENKKLDPEFIALLRSIRSRLNDNLVDLRNLYVHGVLLGRETNGLPKQLIHRGRFKGVKQSITLDALRKFGDEVRSLAMQLDTELAKRKLLIESEIR